MTVFLGADHRGYELKNTLLKWLKLKGYKVVDCGNSIYDPNDDYPDFGKAVARNLKQALHGANSASHENALGIVICGSGVGMAVAANRLKGIYCALAFDVHQTKHARENDHINMISLPSEYLGILKIKRIIEVFIKTKPVFKEKHIRRLKKIDE